MKLPFVDLPFRRATRWRSLLLATCAVALAAAPSLAHPYIKRWAFEGTILSIDDELNIFGGLAATHPIYGTLSFDATISILEENEWGIGEFETIYNQPEEFPVLTLTTENLANGNVATYNPYLSGFMSVWDNITDWSGPGAVEDLILFEQDFFAPNTTTWNGFFAQLQFLAPASRFSNPTLPTELDIDDWRSVTVSLVKLNGPFTAAASLQAEIHTLTPIDVAYVPGDFTGDGAVDARDLDVWQYHNGSINANLAADANGDSRVDGADFLAWQRQLGATPATVAASSANSTIIPEPASLAALLLAALRRPRKNRSKPLVFERTI